MARKKKHPEHVNHERWLVSYADFITLLFAFFVVMFAVSQVDSKKVGRFQDSFSMAVGINSGEHGYLPRKEAETPALLASMAPLPPEIARTDDPPQFPKSLQEIEEDIERRLALDKKLAGLAIVRRGNELVLRMDATALFDSGEDRVKEMALPVLLAVAEELQTKEVKIRVEGHTDDQPIRTLRFRSNWDLSTARATSVVAVLAGPGAIDPRRLMAAGYAEFQPLGSNTTSEGRQKNRRVDFVLSVMLEEIKWTGKELDAHSAGSEGADGADTGTAGPGEAAPAAKPWTDGARPGL